MNLERLFKIILMDLTSDNLKLDAELEKAINSDMDIHSKTQTIKALLAKIVATEASITKFTDILQKTNDSNNKMKQPKQKENGKN